MSCIFLVGPSSIPSYCTSASRPWPCLQHSPNTPVAVCGMFSIPLVLLSFFQNLTVFNTWFQGCTSQLVKVIALAHLQCGRKASSFSSSQAVFVLLVAITQPVYSDTWRPVSHFLMCHVNFVSVWFLNQNRQYEVRCVKGHYLNNYYLYQPKLWFHWKKKPC